MGVEVTQRRPGWLGCEDRIAWLLRINRLYGTDDNLAVAVTFARAFPGAGPARAADPAQISRWERGTHRVDYRILHRYEILLGLPEASLTGTANTVCREFRGTPGASGFTRGGGPDDPSLRQRTHDLLDRALSDDVMSGLDWDELTENLSSLDSVILHPASGWTALAERLLTEMIISDGLDWHLRSESLSRLLGHPSGELPIIDACSSLVADPANQVFIEPLTALEASAHPESAAQLLKQVVNPVNDHAALGALYSVVEKLGRGHFSPPEVAVLARRALAILDAGAGHSGLRTAALEVLRQVPAPLPSAMRKALAAANASGPSAPSPGGHHGADREAFRTFVERVAAAAMRALPREPLSHDAMLTRLLSEMLFHPQITFRVQATKLIEVTPYRAPVAAALAKELRHPAMVADPAWAGPILLALASLGGPVERRLVERLILAQGLSRPVVAAAAWALGHVRGHSGDDFYAEALRASTRSYQATSLSAGHGLIYAMGIGRRMGLLRTLAASPTVPDPLRAAAGWWTSRPTSAMRSTNRSERSPTGPVVNRPASDQHSDERSDQPSDQRRAGPA